VNGLNSLGAMYAKGQGIEKDFIMAYALWDIAAGKGNKIAEENREALTKQLSQEQIAKGRELAKKLSLVKK
jgi:hypothetical protein